MTRVYLFCYHEIMENQTKKVDMRTIRTKKLLAKSLYQLLETTPFEKLTIQNICDNAMVHRTTYYQHFTSKEELLIYTLEDFRTKLFSVTHNNMDHNSPKQMFLHLSTFFVKYVQTKDFNKRTEKIRS